MYTIQILRGTHEKESCQSDVGYAGQQCISQAHDDQLQRIMDKSQYDGRVYTSARLSKTAKRTHLHSMLNKLHSSDLLIAKGCGAIVMKASFQSSARKWNLLENTWR